MRPNGAETCGPADIAASHARSFARFEASQHLLTGHDVDLDGATGAVRANLVAIRLWKDRPVTVRTEDRVHRGRRRHRGRVAHHRSPRPDPVADRGCFGDLAQTR